MANIDAALRAQGSLKQGQQLNVAASATPDAAAPDLVITGALTSSVVTIKRAAMKTAGFMFGGKPLRQGEVGWVGTLSFGAGGQPNASLILS